MFILGDAHAVLPEPLGFADEPRVHVRQRSIVAVLTPVVRVAVGERGRRPDRERGGRARRPAPVPARAAHGGRTDEQIARKLGISLRTVRRRVAALMTELGVDTRFQAGVEAVRRGWL